MQKDNMEKIKNKVVAICAGLLVLGVLFIAAAVICVIFELGLLFCAFIVLGLLIVVLDVIFLVAFIRQYKKIVSSRLKSRDENDKNQTM